MKRTNARGRAKALLNLPRLKKLLKLKTEVCKFKNKKDTEKSDTETVLFYTLTIKVY